MTEKTTFDCTSPCRLGLSLKLGGLQMSAVPLMITATSPTKIPSGCLSSEGSSITSSPILLNASTRSSCSFRAFSMLIVCPSFNGKVECCTKVLAILETMAKLYLKQSVPVDTESAILQIGCKSRAKGVL